MLPYWQRLWVVQEALLSRGTLFVYGNQPMTIDVVMYADALLHLVRVTSANLDRDIPVLLAPTVGRALERLVTNELPYAALAFGVSDKRYLRVFDTSRQLKASDRRDCVYGILGFLCSDHSIVPDYSDSNTVENTFILATKEIIKHDQDLRILAWCFQPAEATALQRPSWVPDLSRKRIHNNAPADVDIGISETPAELPPCISLEPQFLRNNVLECSAKLIGQLATPATLTQIPDESFEDGGKAFLAKCVDFAKIAGLSGKYAPTGEELKTALINCLAVGNGRELALLRNSPDGRAQLATWYKPCSRPGWPWHLFVSPDGFLGLAPKVAECTDVLAPLFDSYTPFVLRPLRKQWGYDFKIIGPVRIHGADVTSNLKKLRRPEFRHQLRRIRIH